MTDGEGLLDNITWHTLDGPHARFSSGNDRARRYRTGFSPIVAFREREHPDFDALRAVCTVGEHFYCDGFAGKPPAGWNVDFESTMFRMVWHGSAPAQDPAPEAVLLDDAHAEQALALAELTKPGPFGRRTIELGDYFGLFEGDRLIAMAGERMHAGTYREISGVCTHPDHQGRGIARRLMLKLVQRQLQRSETPFLHVMRANVGAQKLYERLGFRTYCETVVRVVSLH